VSVQRGSFTCAVSVSKYACSCLGMGGGGDEHIDWFLVRYPVLVTSMPQLLQKACPWLLPLQS